MPARDVAIDFPGYHPQSCHRYHCWTKSQSCRLGIFENGHHVALDLAVVAAVVAAAALVPGPAGALGAVPASGPAVALEVVPVHLAASPAGVAVAAAAVAEGAAALVVTRGVAMGGGFSGLGCLSQQLSQILQLLRRHFLP